MVTFSFHIILTGQTNIRRGMHSLVAKSHEIDFLFHLYKQHYHLVHDRPPNNEQKTRNTHTCSHAITVCTVTLHRLLNDGWLYSVDLISVPLDFKNRAIRSWGFCQLRVEKSATCSIEGEYPVVGFLNGNSSTFVFIGPLTHDMA